MLLLRSLHILLKDLICIYPFGNMSFLSGILLLGLRNRLDLSGDEREGSVRDSAELVEAAPETRLESTFADLSHISVSLLLRAVGDDDEHTKGTSEICDRLFLPVPAGPGLYCGSITIKHTKSLG